MRASRSWLLLSIKRCSRLQQRGGMLSKQRLRQAWHMHVEPDMTTPQDTGEVALQQSFTVLCRLKLLHGLQISHAPVVAGTMAVNRQRRVVGHTHGHSARAVLSAAAECLRLSS